MVRVALGQALAFSLIVSAAACRSVPDNTDSGTASSDVVAADDIPAAPGDQQLKGISFAVRGNEVVAQRCTDPQGDAEPAKVAEASDGKPQGNDCPVVKAMPIQAFRTAFKAAFDAQYGKMTKSQVAILDAAIAAAGSTPKQRKGKNAMVDKEFGRYYQTYFALIQNVFELNETVTTTAPAASDAGMNLQNSERQFMNVVVALPFGQVVNAPIADLGTNVQADRIRIDVSGTYCDANVARPIMVNVGQTPQVGNLVALGNNTFRSNFEGRRLNFRYIQVQFSQQVYRSVECRLVATAILDNANPPPIGGTCRQEVALICPPGQIDNCFFNPQGDHGCVTDPRRPPIGGTCTPLSRQVMAQPSYNHHGGSNVYPYSANNFCVTQVQVDWPGCAQAWVENLTAIGPNGLPVQLTPLAVNNQGKGTYRVEGGAAILSSVHVNMNDTRNFRVVGCQVDVLFR